MNGSLVFYLCQGGQFIDSEEIGGMDELEADMDTRVHNRVTIIVINIVTVGHWISSSTW